MAGVMNNTARQYNVKTSDKNGNYIVRLKPGLNVVDDEMWDKVKDCKYVLLLESENLITTNAKVDKAEKANKSQTKKVNKPK